MDAPLRPAARAWDRLSAGDPGLVRTTTALRAVAGIALTLAVLSFTDLPAAFLVAGCFAPFTVALAAGDSPARDQVFMVVAAVPLVSAVLLVGGALGPFPVAAETVFVLLIFWAVFVRRYGRRGQALGIFAFMAYFLTQFLDARLSQLPGLYAAVGVGFAADALVGFGLLRTTPARTLRRLRRAFDLHLEHVVLGAIEVVWAGRNDTRVTRSLERRVAQLHRSALMIADLLDRGGAADPVRQEIVRAEVAAQRLAVLAIRSGPAFMGTTRDRAPAALLDVHPAIGELMRAVDGLRSVGELMRAVDGLRSVGEVPSYGGPRTNGATRRLRRVATRQAVQAAAAAAIAVVSGEMLSSERWYWAVLTAWVVFVNTESSGEVLVQGFQRLLGTVLGVACGLSIAALAGGCLSLALGVSLVCVFGVFRTPPNAYWAVTFFITCMIAMAFVLLGTFSAELLALRVWETALGALCGVLAGTLVLPTSVRRAGGERLLEVLRALRRTGVLEGGVLLDARELDRALEELRGALRPLTHPLNPRRARRAHARHLLALLESCAYHVRSLAAVTAAAQMSEAAYEARAVERIRANLDHAIRLMEAGTWPAIPCHDGRRTLARLAADRWRGGDRRSRQLFHVNRLDEATAELARTCVMT